MSSPWLARLPPTDTDVEVLVARRGQIRRVLARRDGDRSTTSTTPSRAAEFRRLYWHDGRAAPLVTADYCTWSQGQCLVHKLGPATVPTGAIFLPARESQRRS